MSTLFIRPVGRRRDRRYKLGSVTAKRDAYMRASEPYGRNRKGLKRWLRALRDGTLGARQTCFLWTDAADGPDLMCVVKPVAYSELPEFDDDFVDGDYDDVDDFDDECGMTADGGCTLAGTEWCDFECPFSG
jgi:hypothetical protein